MNQQRISAIAAGSPATPEEARELASMCQRRPLETCPIGEDALFLVRGWRLVDGYITVDEREISQSCVDGWLPLPAAPEVGS